MLLSRLRSLRPQAQRSRLQTLRPLSGLQRSPRKIGQNRQYSQHNGDGSSKEESGSRKEHKSSLLSVSLTWGAVLVATGLSIERWYYGSPTNRQAKGETFGYGSPEDFKQAIEDLRKALSHLEHGVSTTSDDLYAHGFSVNDYHPGASKEMFVDGVVVDLHQECYRRQPYRGCLPPVYRGCRENCQDCNQVPNASNCLFWSYQLGGAISRCE